MTRRRLHTAAGRLGLAAWLLAYALLFGQLGVGPGLFAASVSGADPCCEGGQAADADHTDEADEHGCDEAPDEHGEAACPDDGSGDPCPPGCDDCTCCPGGPVAVVVSLTPPRWVTTVAALPRLPAPEPASGVRGRLFRPPKSCAV